MVRHAPYTGDAVERSPSHSHRSVDRGGRRHAACDGRRDGGLQRFRRDSEFGRSDARDRCPHDDSDCGAVCVSDCDGLCDSPAFSDSDCGAICASDCIAIVSDRSSDCDGFRDSDSCANCFSDGDTVRDSPPNGDSEPDCHAKPHAHAGCVSDARAVSRERSERNHRGPGRGALVH